MASRFRRRTRRVARRSRVRTASRRSRIGATPYRSLAYRNVYRFQRASFTPQWAPTTNAEGYYFNSVVANGILNINGFTMPNISDFSNLFDQYKILSYSLELIPRWSGLDISGDNAPGLPTIYWIYDMDDSTAPSTISELMERPKVRKRVMKGPTMLYVKYPCVAGMVYRSTTTTGYSAKRSPWIDMNDSNVPHYGIKYAIVGTGTTTYTFDVKVTWNFMCKNVR